MTFLEGFVVGAVSVIIIVGYLEQRGDDFSPVEQAKRDYREGRIDAAEFERRLQFHLDDRNEQIRAAVLPVANVGDDTADAIAREFESIDELRRADEEDLTAIHGLGESTAEAVLSRVRE